MFNCNFFIKIVINQEPKNFGHCSIIYILSLLYICHRRNGSVSRNGLIKRIFIFLNTVKIFNVRICNPTIFAFNTLGVKWCFHPYNDHIKAI